jgi:hypothetical protein
LAEERIKNDNAPTISFEEILAEDEVYEVAAKRIVA